MRVIRAFVWATVLVVGGCASGPSIFTNEDPKADFSRYTTYDFQVPLGTDRNDGVRTPLSQYLIDAVGAELDARGYVRQVDAPSMIVNVYLHTEEKLQTFTVPSSGYYGHGYRSGYYGAWGGYETETYQYTQGTLSVDLVDPSRKVLIWEGFAEGEISRKVRENLQAAVSDAVADIFAKYPHSAGIDGSPTR